MTADTPVLTTNGIYMSFGGVNVLKDINFEIYPGEVHALVGENGAGKSTLMKILGGTIAPDCGMITIGSKDYESLTPAVATELGIAFVHQELNLFENLDVAANIFIGREPHRYGFLRLVDNARLHGAVKPLLERLGASFAPTTVVEKLSLAQRQMVEIAKVLSLDARLVIFDEPTSALPVAETDKLLEVIAELKVHGISTIFISHRLNEIVKTCDRVLVLRDGRPAGVLKGEEISHDAMVKLMVGRDLKVAYKHPAKPRTGTVLSTKRLRTSSYPNKEIDLDLYGGEILGLAGLVGAGRTELARVLFGIDDAFGGSIRLNEKEIRFRSSADAVKAGVFLVPEDRKAAGLLLDMTIAENISLPNLSAHSRNLLVSRDSELVQAEKSRIELDIRAPGVTIRTETLSGGNQQKVVLAKWLAMNPKVIIFDEPTRGIDIGAKTEIYTLLRSLADNDVAVLVISSDMEEVIGISDRVAVMHEGHISGILDRSQCSEENILKLAVGKPA
jgi:ribose transport system ATP-binding protein